MKPINPLQGDGLDGNPPVAHPQSTQEKKLQSWKQWALYAAVLCTAGLVLFGLLTLYFNVTLPKLNKLTDYQPSLVTEIYARNGKKFAEYSNERRFLVDYEAIPEMLINAFLAAEDSKFFEHEGIDFRGIMRAFFTNLRAGRIVQGGSTITQQVAKSFLLSSERSFRRKLKEIVLARKIEKNLTKKEILYLYLNQIYFGHGSYGVQAASMSYFNKDVKELNLAECAFLAGLPQAPSRYSPFRSPDVAKERQVHVLNRMVDEGYLTQSEMEKVRNLPLSIYNRQDMASEHGAADFAEYVRRYVQDKYGAKAFYEEGLQVYTTLNLDKQIEAEKAVRQGLEELDKRQGYRGVLGHLDLHDEHAVEEFLLAAHQDAMNLPYFEIPGWDNKAVGINDQKKPPEKTPLEAGRRVRALVTGFDAQGNFMDIKVGHESGRVQLEDMKWVRSPDPDVRFDEETFYLKDPRKKFKLGDQILVSYKSPAETKNNKKYDKDMAYFVPEQDPAVQGALISLDPHHGAILAMVGGYDFKSSEFNRAVQGLRQPGSSFKPIVYAAALDKGYTGSSIIVDSPIVYETEMLNNEEEEEKWKPKNYADKFHGDTPFRVGLVKSMNIITIKILQDIGVDYVTAYARKLGITAPLNRDLSLALGSSSLTLMELTNAYSVFANEGKKVTPYFITKVLDHDGKVLEEYVAPKELPLVNETINPEEPPKTEKTGENLRLSEREREILYPSLPPGYVISPQTAYLMTQLLSDVIQYGTGQRARSLGRPAAGKTGTTNEESDAWFIGYTPDIVTGVWVGYDLKKPLGRGEAGGKTAAPIWTNYMKEATKHTPVRSFPIPPQIVFATVIRETGYLAKANTPEELRIRAAYLEGTQPTTTEPPKNTLPDDQFYLIDSQPTPPSLP